MLYLHKRIFLGILYRPGYFGRPFFDTNSSRTLNYPFVNFLFMGDLRSKSVLVNCLRISNSA